MLYKKEHFVLFHHISHLLACLFSLSSLVFLSSPAFFLSPPPRHLRQLCCAIHCTPWRELVIIAVHLSVISPAMDANSSPGDLVLTDAACQGYLLNPRLEKHAGTVARGAPFVFRPRQSSRQRGVFIGLAPGLCLRTACCAPPMAWRRRASSARWLSGGEGGAVSGGLCKVTLLVAQPQSLNLPCCSC